MLAVSEGHTKTIELLLDRGADVDYEGESGDTPLILAARHGRTSTLALLARYGADLDWENAHGMSALGVAVGGKRIDSIQTLLDLGASVQARTPIGKDPMRLAIASGELDIVKLLTPRCQNPADYLEDLSSKPGDQVAKYVKAQARKAVNAAYRNSRPPAASGFQASPPDTSAAGDTTGDQVVSRIRLEDF